MQPDEQREAMERTRFFLRNLLRGLIWLAVIVGGYFYLKSNFDFTLEDVLGPVYEQPVVIYLIFLVSEVVFGIIPPELFMIWALKSNLLGPYIGHVAGFSAISYFAGLVGYYVGSHFGNTRLYRTIRKNYLRRFEKYFTRFGGFLVIVAALTPIPFAGVCMLMGAVKYPYRRFLLFSMTRFLRFVVYGFIIWEANILQ